MNRQIPLILTGRTMQSLRDSGYDFAAAIAEPVDNSLEAAANTIQIIVEEGEGKKKKHVNRIAFADDGHGMGMTPDGDILHHYLQIGFSTRWMSKTTIGKYGVGAKLAALQFATRIDVWSRTSGSEPWRHAYFDLDEVLEAEGKGLPPGIQEPDTDPIPKEFQGLLGEGSGTLVVWSKIDRLGAGRRAPDVKALVAETIKEASRIFRYFLHGGIQISINGNDLLPHDPLFLMDKSWAEKVLREHQPAQVIGDEKIKVGKGEAHVRLTLYPKNAIRPRGRGGDDLSKNLRIPENQGCISFVRLDREINYTVVPRIFPRGIQEPDRYIGIEVAFDPSLDDYFGVRIVKRGLEPDDNLRKKILSFLKRHVPTARSLLEEHWGAMATKIKERGERDPIVERAAGRFH